MLQEGNLSVGFLELSVYTQILVTCGEQESQETMLFEGPFLQKEIV